MNITYCPNHNHLSKYSHRNLHPIRGLERAMFYYINYGSLKYPTIKGREFLLLRRPSKGLLRSIKIKIGVLLHQKQWFKPTITPYGSYPLQSSHNHPLRNMTCIGDIKSVSYWYNLVQYQTLPFYGTKPLIKDGHF